MGRAVAVREREHVARPVAVLVPLIQQELSAGKRAGLDHYRRAGEMLIEAREQVAPFKWTQWLSKNFHLSRSTAYDYINLVVHARQDPDILNSDRPLREISRPNSHANYTKWQRVVHATNKVDVDEYAEAKLARAAEVSLHRDLALELIDIGYKALATRLHPDRGGSRDAMRRLNRVRDELKTVAATRRYE